MELKIFLLPNILTSSGAHSTLLQISSIYFTFHKSNKKKKRTYRYGNNKIKIKKKNNLHKYKLYC
jgi:hypothetical protein